MKRLVPYIALVLFLAEVVLIFSWCDIEECVTLKTDAPHHDVVAIRHGRILTVFQIVELCPWAHQKEIARIARDVLHRYIFIMLWSVGSHLQP